MLKVSEGIFMGSVSKKLKVQLKLSLRYIMQKKDTTGKEYINKAIVANDDGVPFFGLKRENNDTLEMNDEEMESFSVLGTYMWDASQRSKEYLEEFENIDHVTLGLSGKLVKQEMAIVKEGNYLIISIYDPRE